MLDKTIGLLHFLGRKTRRNTTAPPPHPPPRCPPLPSVAPRPAPLMLPYQKNKPVTIVYDFRRAPPSPLASFASLALPSPPLDSLSSSMRYKPQTNDSGTQRHATPPPPPPPPHPPLFPAPPFPLRQHTKYNDSGTQRTPLPSRHPPPFPFLPPW